MKIIGIDLGTTTISAVVIESENREVLCSVTEENGAFIDTGNDWEKIQAPAVIIGKATGILNKLLDTYPDSGAIGLTGQMHGIVYVNRNGKAVSPLYTWQDGRGEQKDENGKSFVEHIREQCGRKEATGYGLVTHLYQAEHQLVPENAEGFCTIADYLGMELTGRSKPFMHTSMAASLGFFDVQKGRFDTEVLMKLGVDLSMLPEITPDIAVLGKCGNLPVTVALGDNQASYLGAVGMDEEAALLNIGTGGQISLPSKIYFETGGIEARPFIGGKYLLAGSSLCGGRAYAMLERFFRSIQEAAGNPAPEQYEMMQRLAEKGKAKKKREE